MRESKYVRILPGDKRLKQLIAQFGDIWTVIKEKERASCLQGPGVYVESLNKIHKRWVEKRFSVVMSPQDLWDLLGDIPIDEDECIEESFLSFEIGTDREDIWHWFEGKFDLSVAVDLMGL